MRAARLLAVIGLFAAAPAGAQMLPGDVDAGKTIALQRCTRCHVVAAQQPVPDIGGAPSFAAIARMRSTTELSLRAFLQTPHPPMPDLVLSREETDDLVSYILSLRRD
jgi:mono/diheme cytochrome c family protein